VQTLPPRRERSLFVVTVLFAISTAFAGSKPNILFLLSDDHSYPYLSCYNDPNVTTPAIDRLASEGIQFHRFFTGAPQCVPSRATLLTGRSPVAARITRFSAPLPREEVTFPEVLKEKAGYFVGVCGRSYHLDGSGNARGTTVGELMDTHGLRTFERRFDYVNQGSDAKAVDQMKEFLDQKPAGKPFCLWLNFSDPHHPWNAPGQTTRPAKLTLPKHWPDLPGVREQLADYCGEVKPSRPQCESVLEVLAGSGLAEAPWSFSAG